MTLESLLVREHALVDALLAAQTNKEIGAALGFSENTVKVYLSRLYQKYHVRSRMQLANLMREKASAL